MQLPQLLEFVQRRIHEGAGIAVHVSEEDGCVVLSGTVPSDAVGKRIQTIAQQTLDELAPATLLVNNLDLDPTGFPWDAFPPDHTSDHAGKGEAHEGESLALGSDGAG